MGYIAVFITDKKKLGYRPIPSRFEDTWKVDSRIKTEDGSENCTIKFLFTDTEHNYNYIRKTVNSFNRKPRQVLTEEKRSYITRIEKLKEEANTKEGKLLMAKYLCTIDEFSFENIEQCFTRLIINDFVYFCRLIRMTDDNLMTYNKLESTIPKGAIIFGTTFAVFEKDFEPNYDEGFVYIKNEIEYTIQIVRSFSLESVLKRLVKFKEIRDDVIKRKKLILEYVKPPVKNKQTQKKGDSKAKSKKQTRGKIFTSKKSSNPANKSAALREMEKRLE